MQPLGPSGSIPIGVIGIDLPARKRRGILPHITEAAAMAAPAIWIEAESPAVAGVFLRAENAFRLLRFHLEILEETSRPIIRGKKSAGHAL
jgi:hypothetical protein